MLEVNVAERWARVEPGIVLDELNASLRPHGLRFAPDVSTASRATVGGMMANNSSGARSVIYGKTIDHVLEQDVVLADGSVAHFGPLDDAEAERRGGAATLEGALLPRRAARWRATQADEIERRYPKVLRRVGGYNLDEFVDPARPFNLAKLLVGSEGTLGRGGRAPRSTWCRCRRPRRCWRSSSPTSWTRWPPRRSSCGTGRRRSR